MDSSRQGETGSFPGEKKTGTVYVPSEIAQNLKVADEDASFRYDETARNLVAEKPILAYILKSSLDEYAGYTVQEIAERFIEGEPELRNCSEITHDNDKSASAKLTCLNAHLRHQKILT